MTVAVEGERRAEAALFEQDDQSGAANPLASASSQSRPPAIAAHSGRRFSFSVVGCTALLLALLWGGIGLELAFDKAQTTYHASVNVANLSQIVDEHLTGVLSEIDRALTAAKREYETRRSDLNSRELATSALPSGASVASIQVIPATEQDVGRHPAAADG